MADDDVILEDPDGTLREIRWSMREGYRRTASLLREALAAHVAAGGTPPTHPNWREF